jgi:hypothetical protein
MSRRQYVLNVSMLEYVTQSDPMRGDYLNARSVLVAFGLHKDKIGPLMKSVKGYLQSGVKPGAPGACKFYEVSLITNEVQLKAFAEVVYAHLGYAKGATMQNAPMQNAPMQNMHMQNADLPFFHFSADSIEKLLVDHLTCSTSNTAVVVAAATITSNESSLQQLQQQLRHQQQQIQYLHMHQGLVVNEVLGLGHRVSSLEDSRRVFWSFLDRVSDALEVIPEDNMAMVRQGYESEIEHLRKHGMPDPFPEDLEDEKNPAKRVEILEGDSMDTDHYGDTADDEDELADQFIHGEDSGLDKLLGENSEDFGRKNPSTLAEILTQEAVLTKDEIASALANIRPPNIDEDLVRMNARMTARMKAAETRPKRKQYIP